MASLDKQRAVLALCLVSRASTAALAATAPAPVPDPTPLPPVLADLDALLARVYTSTTKLSLALGPTAPAYAAAVPVLHDLAQHTSALAHASRLVRDDLHGATLAKDLRNRVRGIIDALRALVQTFLNNAARGPQLPSSGMSGEEYLVRTGTLHDLITSARGPSGIPKDNRTAVRLSWKLDRESLEDSLHELACMITEAESGHPTELDDGWDELGLGNAAGMDMDELARAKNVHRILRLTTLVHKRIFLDLLAHPSSAPAPAFDALLTQSNLLLSTADDLVASLYAPQDPSHVRNEIVELANIVTSLRAQIPVFLPATDELVKQLCALNIENDSPPPASTSPSKKRADKKWFDTCVDQIVHLCTSMSESSRQTDRSDGAT